MPIACDLTRVRKAIGSKDVKISQAIRRQYMDMMSGMTDPDELHLSLLVKHLILGLELKDAHASRYAYALQFLCMHYGKFLSNEHWFGMSSQYLDDVDAVLKQAGIPEKTLSVLVLLYRGPPIPLPPIEDFPFIGYLLAREIPPAIAAYDRADFSSATGSIRDSLAGLRGWLEHCAANQHDLACFYY